MRKETGDEKYVTEMDLDLRPVSERLRVFLLRPFQLLFQELIVFFISLYMSVLYGLLYMLFIVGRRSAIRSGRHADVVHRHTPLSFRKAKAIQRPSQASCSFPLHWESS